MQRGTALKAMLAVAAAFLLQGQANAPIEGHWVADGDWAQTPIFPQCVQAWICVPKQPTMYASELKLVGPDRQQTYGSCDVAGGAIDSCNACRVLTPSEPCTLTLEAR